MRPTASCPSCGTRLGLPPQFATGLLSTAEGLCEVPDWPPRALALPTFADKLERLPRPGDFARAFYLVHQPPARLGLDVCGDGREVASHALRAFIPAREPHVTLQGHIHESPVVSGVWRARLSRTLSIQPGQLDAVTYVVLDLETLLAERLQEPVR